MRSCLPGDSLNRVDQEFDPVLSGSSSNQSLSSMGEISLYLISPDMMKSHMWRIGSLSDWNPPEPWLHFWSVISECYSWIEDSVTCQPDGTSPACNSVGKSLREGWLGVKGVLVKICKNSRNSDYNPLNQWIRLLSVTWGCQVSGTVERILGPILSPHTPLFIELILRSYQFRTLHYLSYLILTNKEYIHYAEYITSPFYNRKTEAQGLWVYCTRPSSFYSRACTQIQSLQTLGPHTQQTCHISSPFSSFHPTFSVYSFFSIGIWSRRKAEFHKTASLLQTPIASLGCYLYFWTISYKSEVPTTLWGSINSLEQFTGLKKKQFTYC